MFTQCPNCDTTFKVSADQLKAANGDVRCGQCLLVFNALENLREEYTTDNHQADPESNTAGEEYSTDISDTTTIKSSSIDQDLEEFFGGLFEDSPNDTFDTPIEHTKPEVSKYETTKSAGGFFYGANEATIEKILKEENAGQLEPDIEPDIEYASETIIDIDDDTGISSDVFMDGLQSDTDITTGTKDFTSDPNKIPNRQGSNSEPERASEIRNVPAVILEELQAAKEQQLKAPNTQWIVGSIVLMLVFVLQAVYFSRDNLAKNLTYRPILTNVCEVLGCEINIAYDIKLIDIIGRDVRSHPTSKKALIAGTTLINNATYNQPYPLLTLTFSDITGTKIAQRRFTPREYLRSDADISAGMPPEVPVRVELQLVDPGKAAVNYEFRAEMDPRA